MRYYDFAITPIAGGAAVRHFTSHPNGPSAPPDEGALKIEFDLIVSPYAIAAGSPDGGGDYGSSLVRVWGIPISDIAQAANLSAPTGSGPTFNATLKGGMGKGLPLANPAQVGTLVRGSVWRAIGNWIDTDMVLDVYLSALPATRVKDFAADGTPNLPANNFSFHWGKGEPLATAINNAMMAAYPGMKWQISVNPRLVLDHDVDGIYTTPQNFTEFLNERSNSILGPGNPKYQGVQMFVKNGVICITDFSTEGSLAGTGSNGGADSVQSRTVAIAFTDLIGQPTWVGNATIQVTAVLRGDIGIGDFVTLPPTLTTVQGAGALQATSIENFASSRFSSVFQGKFQVTKVRHVGDYKAPSAKSWVTVLEAVSASGPLVGQTPPPTSGGPAPTPAPLAEVPGLPGTGGAL